MNLAHLETFLAVYRAENITAAARKRHVSQPTITAHLKALEAELGSPLFLRLPRGVSPTPLAHRLADDLATPLDAIHHTIAGFSSSARPAAATCFLGGPSDALDALVLPALIPLIDGGLRLRVRVGLTGPLVQALSDGELDLVIATTPARRRNVVTEALAVETLQLVGGPMSARPPSGPDLVSFLRDAPLVAYDDGTPLVRRYFREQFPGEAPPAPRVTVPDLRGLAGLVKRGAGWTVLPDYLAAAGLNSGDIRLLHRPEMPTTNQLYLATRASRRHHPSIASVHDHLVGALGQPTGEGRAVGAGPTWRIPTP